MNGVLKERLLDDSTVDRKRLGELLVLLNRERMSVLQFVKDDKFVVVLEDWKNEYSYKNEVERIFVSYVSCSWTQVDTSFTLCIDSTKWIVMNLFFKNSTNLNSNLALEWVLREDPELPSANTLIINQLDLMIIWLRNAIDEKLWGEY